MRREHNKCPLRPRHCIIDCRANLRGGECQAPFVEDIQTHSLDTIRQYNIDVEKELQQRANSEVFAFEKDYFDGAHALFIILRNKGLLKL